MPTRVLTLLGLLLSGCARLLLGAGEPYQPWRTPAAGVEGELRGETLVLRPPPGAPPRAVLLFLHGFASTPAQHRFTLEQLAARGFVVHAPTLPDYWLLRIGYHRAVLEAAEAAYATAEAEARGLGLGPPVVVGFSMGGGAALLVAAGRARPAVLWAPMPLDLELKVPAAPLLVIAADHDCVVKERPAELVRALKGAARAEVIPGNHLGFTDRSGDQGLDCPSPVSRDAQRAEAVARSAAFLEAALAP